jgi:glycosyltransferase involved in cell wall biosynthesis
MINLLHKYIDNIFVIYLEKNKQKQSILNYFNKFNLRISLFPGVDGFNDKYCLDLYANYFKKDFEDPLTHPTEKQYKRKLIKSPGAIGLIKTYEKILKESIRKNYNKIIIFEEDALLDKNFNEKLVKFLKHINFNFDIVHIGCSHHVWKNPEIKQIDPEIYLNYYKSPVVLDGSFATIYDKKIYKELINHIKKYNAPYDLYLREIIKKNNSYTIYPNIAIADTTQKSSITNTSRNLREHKNLVRWKTDNIDFTRSINKVSILLANYNSEQNIKYVLNSIKNQSYNNIELILVDDNSTDNCLKTIKQWIINNKNINVKLIELNSNVGAYKCRNIALKESSGFFISIIDSDDYFLKNKIEVDVYNYFNNSDCDIFFGQMYRSQTLKIEDFSEEKKLIKSIEKEREQFKDKNIPWEYKFRFGLPTIFTAKDFFDKYGCWRDDFRFGMDIELVQRYVLKKYNVFMSNKEMFLSMYKNLSRNYGIFVSEQMHYVSFPMNDNNATNLCKGEERERIHEIVNNDLAKEAGRSK